MNEGTNGRMIDLWCTTRLRLHHKNDPSARYPPTHTSSSSGTYAQWNHRSWNRTISTRTSSRSRLIVYPLRGCSGGCSTKEEILRGGWLEEFQSGVFRVCLFPSCFLLSTKWLPAKSNLVPNPTSRCLIHTIRAISNWRLRTPLLPSPVGVPTHVIPIIQDLTYGWYNHANTQ
jgi:hypothetical protein